MHMNTHTCTQAYMHAHELAYLWASVHRCEHMCCVNACTCTAVCRKREVVCLEGLSAILENGQKVLFHGKAEPGLHSLVRASPCNLNPVCEPDETYGVFPEKRPQWPCLCVTCGIFSAPPGQCRHAAKTMLTKEMEVLSSFKSRSWTYVGLIFIQQLPTFLCLLPCPEPGVGQELQHLVPTTSAPASGL